MTLARRLGVWLGVVLAAAALVAPAMPAAAATTAVQANSFRFCAGAAPLCLPTDTGFSVTVPAGSQVTWTYTDTACDAVVPCPGHNVTFADGGGKTIKSEGASLLTRSFTKPGTFNYFCSIHQSFGMTGVVVVATAAGGAPTTAPPGSTVRAVTTLPRTGRPVAAPMALGLEAVATGALLVALSRSRLNFVRPNTRR